MLRHWAASHPGAVRIQNQDSYICRPTLGLFSVADGAGGHSEGEVASTQVVKLLGEMSETVPPSERLAEVRVRLHAVHDLLLEKGRSQVPQVTLATTVIVLMVHGDHFAFLWAGDSRGYLLRDGTLHRLTSDHSLVQELVDSGTITTAEAETHPLSNVITRAVGAGGHELLIDKIRGIARPDDRLLLCSDGLYKTLSSEEMVEIMARDGDVAEMLVAAALAQHARDNITAVVTAF
ncbi:serine/threonine-protein phosphatase [Rhizobium sp. P32RR-XVIII]|nr:serine/threonine-protein phosphatase [Rhizobium sp. P32RR-XVIII]